MSDLPSTQFARASVVGRTAVRVGVGKLKVKAKRPFLSEQARQLDKERHEDQEAELLFKAITQLRGTAAKLAQMLGMETDLLPERVREELSKSYHQIPPLNRVLVRKVITKELGEAPERIFEKFNAEAIAAASLGQVHAAEINQGKKVAVKVQYPGIHVSIVSDLKLLRTLSSSGIKLLHKNRQPNQDVVDTSIDEIESRLKEEIDYRIEASNTRWFKEHLHVDGMEVPEVYSQFCTERIITTEMLDGQHLDDWLATKPSQEIRNKAAQLIYDTFVFSTIKLGRLHADPNPGNYLFKTNGDLALIDFGCVKQLNENFIEHIPNLLYAFYLSDFERIVAAYEKIGTTIAADSQQDYESVLRPFGEWLSKPVMHEYFDFKENKDYTSSGLSLIKGLAEMPSLETLDEDFIFFDRTLYGLFKIFERLEAKVYMRGHWEALWDGSAD